MLRTFLKLVRFQNLVFVAAIQLFLWFFMLKPLYHFYNQITALDTIHLLLLTLSTVLIAAGGYVINDLQDVGIDIINKPDEIVISREIRKKRAYNIYYFLMSYINYQKNN